MSVFLTAVPLTGLWGSRIQVVLFFAAFLVLSRDRICRRPLLEGMNFLFLGKGPNPGPASWLQLLEINVHWVWWGVCAPVCQNVGSFIG